MRTLRFTALAAGLAAALSLSGCSSSDSSSNDGNGDLYIVTCSLGCTNGQGGEQVFCSIVNTYQNQELAVLFSEPLDLFSVNSSSFRVVNVANGTSPTGQFFRDPLNPRRLIFRPSLTFDENGSPVFGFDPFTTYQITIPGVAQGDAPPYVQSVAGRPNQSRLQCTILTSEGIIDPVPGPPSVEYYVTLVTSYDQNGDPATFEHDVLVTDVPELVDVWRNSDIDFYFDDVMNVATLLNPSTGKAPFIKVQYDKDGNLSTLSDRENIEGKYTFSVDLETLETFLTFKSDLPFPSAGPDAPADPRRIAVVVPDSVLDLVANPVTIENGGGTKGFVPELSKFSETTLPAPGGEDFVFSYPSEMSREDGNRSGGAWGGGRLAPRVGGGSGRLGDMILPAGLQITLNTDDQTFPLGQADGLVIPWEPDIIGNPDVNGDFPTEFTVNDGAFEFGTVIIEAGASLRFEGSQAARVFTRGRVTIENGGQISLTGVTPPPHDSGILVPEDDLPVFLNAANGADGGFGADRFDMGGNTDMLNLGGENDAVDIKNNGFFGDSDPDGRQGQGVGRDNGSDGNGGGPGGDHWPVRYPTVDLSTLIANNQHGVNFNTSDAWNLSDDQCRSFILGGSGGGGAFALDGGMGVSISDQPQADYFNFTQSNNGPDTAGGDSTQVGLNPPNEFNQGYGVRKLEYGKGNLIGGSGGGGGGNHPFGTQADGFDGTNTNACIGPDSFFVAWHDHSGSQGGYGGGAIQVTAGARIQIDGAIDASGGDGASARQGGGIGDPDDFGQYAMPGGGGSGGAIKLQSIVVELADQPGRLNVAGGLGGVGEGAQWQTAIGGDGSPGLVRIEDFIGQASRSELAPSILPWDPSDDSLSWVSVDDGMDDPQDPEFDGKGWTTARTRPGSVQASSSCWMRPEGDFFSLSCLPDEGDPDVDDPDLMGWNMNVIWQPTPNDPELEFPFRGIPVNDPNFPFNNSFETEFGKNFGEHMGMPAAPIVVRFQGARVNGDFERCDFDLNDPNDFFVPGSISPWVDHPIKLNDFTPNLVRYVIIFDGTIDPDNNDTPGLILYGNIRGVTKVGIKVQPD